MGPPRSARPLKLGEHILTIAFPARRATTPTSALRDRRPRRVARHVTRVAVAVAVLAAPVAAAGTATAADTGTFDHPYASSSPWNTRLDDDARVTTWTNPLTKSLQQAAPVINRDHWSVAVYQATSSDPQVTLEDVRNGRSYTARIPAGAATTGGLDKHMTVVQPDGVTSYDAYKMEKVSSTLWRAQVVHVDRLDGQGMGGGVRAAGVPAIAGLIRAHEVAEHDIPHALAVAVPGSVLKQGPVWPAVRQDSDAATSYSGQVPMGSRLALPDWVDLDSLGLSAEGRALAEALQEYGAYVVDRSDTAALYCEPGCDYAATERMKADWRELWSQLRVVKDNAPS